MARGDYNPLNSFQQQFFINVVTPLQGKKLQGSGSCGLQVLVRVFLELQSSMFQALGCGKMAPHSTHR